jgi:hypothetical protein
MYRRISYDPSASSSAPVLSPTVVTRDLWSYVWAINVFPFVCRKNEVPFGFRGLSSSVHSVGNEVRGLELLSEYAELRLRAPRRR